MISLKDLNIAVLAAVLTSTALADPILDSQPAPKIALVAPPIAQPFSLKDVRLLDGEFKDAQDAAAGYLLSLEADRLLAWFRKEAGLEPKAENYGGWEARGIAGHSLGHYLTGCALAYASTGDDEFMKRVNYVVDELAECQAANGDGYLAAIPEGRQAYEEVSRGNIRSGGFDLNGIWVPNYTEHKVLAGLRDAYRLCDSQKALEVERGLADWFEKIHEGLTDEQMQRVLACEHGGINETFADLYADTGDERYLALARKFHHKAILDPLAQGQDILPGKHANTQIPKLVGLATLYEVAGNSKDRAAANFFWDRVVNHHSYVTGGHCDAEHFGQPDQLNDRLSPASTETCNVYNMLKLTRHVFGWNPDAEVADFYERAWLNHMRASQHPDGRVIYNLSLEPGHHKEYQSQFDGFTCCVGSGMESHVKYGEGIYFHDEDTLWVNLFIPSELKWIARGVVLRQETQWPDEETTTLVINCDSPQEFTLQVRYPYWADALHVKVNGEPVPVTGEPSSYCQIRRTWQTGDTVEVTFPMQLRTESMPDNPNRIAIFYGPVVLAADLGPVNDPQAGKPGYVPILLTEGRPVADWVKAMDGRTLGFRTEDVGRPRDVELTPFFRLHDRRYSVYLDRYTADEWAEREERVRAKQEQLRKLEARTVDVFRPGEMQPERDHNVMGENTDPVEALGRKLRHAYDGGWFSYEMKVDPQQPNELLCHWWGSESGQRTFDILVENQKIATQTLLNNRPGEFWDSIYAIPVDLTRGREKVTVKLQAHPGNHAGGLFGSRTLRVQSK